MHTLLAHSYALEQMTGIGGSAGLACLGRLRGAGSAEGFGKLLDNPRILRPTESSPRKQ